MLDAGDTRLVTLTGPGGIGKTRLALAVAASLAGDFAHGAHVVSLASVRDASLVPPTVAQALGVSPSGDMPVSDVLVSYLRDQHALLLLDNLEQVVDGAAPWIADLLARCPRLHVLATSRVALRIAGERRLLVEPLSLPDVAGSTAVERVRESEAVRLLVDRAHAVRSEIALTEETAQDIAGICRALDGVPLAIELAAARVSVLSLPALRARLTNRLSLLTEGQRDAPPRHQTMREAIAWSYDLLAGNERRLFRRLSVFTGGFTVEAAEAMGEESDRRTAVIDSLAALVEHSLVRRVSGDREEDRFELLETIREYGLERLAEHEEDVVARDAHSAYFQGLVTALERRVQDAPPAELGAAQVAFLDRLEDERDNLRAVIAWLTQQARIEEAMALAVAIWPFHGSRGHDVEALSTLEALLTHPLVTERSITRADALHAVGNFARSQGDSARSVAASEEAIAIYRELGEHGHAGRALLSLGWVTMDDWRLDEALGHYRESLRLARSVDDREGVAEALDMMGLLFLMKSEHAMAREHLQEARDICQDSGDRARLANVLGHLGLLTKGEGSLPHAARLLEESIAIGRDVGDWHLLVMDLKHLADIHWQEGDRAAAEACLLETLTIARRTGYVGGMAVARVALAGLALAAGDLQRAIQQLRESFTGYQRIDARNALTYSGASGFDTFACLALAVDDVPRAARFLGMVDGMFDRIGVPRPLGEPHIVDRRQIDVIRAALENSAIRAEWEVGFALDDEAMVAKALAFELPADDPQTQIDAAIPEAAMGLSVRELEVLRLMADGLTNQEIADALSISERTASSHASNILGKLGLSSRTAVVAYAIRNGLA